MGMLLKGETKATATMPIKKQRIFFQQRARKKGSGKGRARDNDDDASFEQHSDSKYTRKQRGKKRARYQGDKGRRPDHRNKDKGTKHALRKIYKCLDALKIPGTAGVVPKDGESSQPKPTTKKCHKCQQVGHIKAHCPNNG